MTVLSSNHTLTVVCIIALSASIAGAEDGAPGHAFFKKNCVKCHNAEKHKGDVRLDQLSLRVTDENHELWEEVVHNIQRGDMPPEDAKQPKADERRAFLAEAIGTLTRYKEDAKGGRDPLTRLTNNQIAHSLQDLLKTHEHIAEQLIGDPVDKHGFSRQSELDLSGSYLQLYADALERIIERAIPNIEPTQPNVFRIAGNDWEKCHWAGDNYLYLGHRRLYEGPKWIGDDFEITIPPKHEYRMFLRENRGKGRFRIKLTLRNEPPTYGYGEHFLIKPGSAIAKPVPGQEALKNLTEPQTVQIPHAGIYQVDVFLRPPSPVAVAADSSKLQEGLVAAWGFDGDTQSKSKDKEWTGKLVGGAKYLGSPIGKDGKAISLDGRDDSVVIQRNPSMDVGKGDFTVTAWINPSQLRQGGIVCLGRYNWVHGWYMDMLQGGVLRIETVSPANQSNGTVATKPGTLRANTWQHVAAVVRRGENQTRVYINGFEVASGTVAPTNLDNPSVTLHIGRVQGSRLFKGQMDEVRFYKRALDLKEIHALLEPGKQFVRKPPEPPQELALNLGGRDFTGSIHQPAFLGVRLPAGPLQVSGRYGDGLIPHRINLTPMPAESELAIQYRQFEQREAARTPQELAVYLGKTTYWPYKMVKAIKVPAKKGLQRFEIFGNLRDHLGVNTDPIVANDPTNPGKFRTLTIVNHNELRGYKLPARFRTSESIFCVRSDDQWIKAFGPKPGLIGSKYGNDNDHHDELTRAGAPVYWKAMKTHGHVIIKQVDYETPYFESWPPKGSAQFLDKGRLTRESLPNKVKSFAAKAWRRPLGSADAVYVEKVITQELAANDSTLSALRNTVVTILSDPRFFYLRQSDNYDLVSRLSYFLWNGPPDETALALAAPRDELSAAAIEGEVDRLLADPRSKRFINDFVANWIGFTTFDQTAVDPNFYPQFRRHLRDHMKQESVEFFSEILFKDLSCLNFLESDFVMVNGWLADHYRIPGVHTQRFTRVAAPTVRGGGALAQGSVLLAYSTGQDAHAVNRGVWIRSRLLGDPPSEPPPNVPALGARKDKPTERGPLSIKQRLESHLAAGTTCYDCHKDIDPWGIAMEGFDAVGLPRTKIKLLPDFKKSNLHARVSRPAGGTVVKDVVIDEQTIDGLVPLKQHLLKTRKKAFAYAFTRHFLSHALGRPISYRDEEQVIALQKAFENSGYYMMALIKAIVTSPAFRTLN